MHYSIQNKAREAEGVVETKMKNIAGKLLGKEGLWKQNEKHIRETTSDGGRGCGNNRVTTGKEGGVVETKPKNKDALTTGIYKLIISEHFYNVGVARIVLAFSVSSYH